METGSGYFRRICSGSGQFEPESAALVLLIYNYNQRPSTKLLSINTALTFVVVNQSTDRRYTDEDPSHRTWHPTWIMIIFGYSVLLFQGEFSKLCCLICGVPTILDNFKSLHFFLLFGVRRTIDVLENHPGSGALGLTEDVWHQKYKTKEKASKIF